ncbi:histidine ammonia-lyase [Robertkochia aurantiaca]|uniref:histidine ammonia-lyase n=1 Tax=Robertkochia aurantiaca TaxID=2873700 RepID=UPI001CCD305D|nr:histidine ammonia-lyase [Robertkochia sp. 3YJGBD-33]
MGDNKELTYEISSEEIDLEQIRGILEDNKKLRLSHNAREKIIACRNYLDRKIEEVPRPIYGINTGFGSLCNIKIAGEHLSALQENLVMSHASGTGDLVPAPIVKLMLLLKIQSLSYGYSGVQLSTVERLIELYNHNVLPVVYTQGSLGASGDLAPLAHLALPLLGRGEVYFEGERKKTTEAYQKLGWKPVSLRSKEGLALLNGTQFMSAYGVWCMLEAYRISYQADLIGAISLEAFNGLSEPFHELIHKVRPHRGQILTAKRILSFLEGSELNQQPKNHVQDPYSFRCMPQVHGASKGVLAHVRSVFRTEINGVTDNPNVFVEEDEVLSGGNFHGQPLALALDYLAMALSEWSSISERRTYQLISGQRGLPAFLINDPGLHSGLMIPQYTAAGIVSQNKQLASPASVDSIVSSNGQEDHVSMGANAATKLYKVVENTKTVLAIELFNAAQALHFRRPLRTSDRLENIYEKYVKVVPFVDHDRIFHDDIMRSRQFLEEMPVDSAMLND